MQKDITKLKFSSLNKQSFNVIYANLSLHYFKDIVTTDIFSSLYDLLALDGFLFVRCKSVNDFLYGRGTEIEKDMFNNNGKMQHLFSVEYLDQKLHQFSVVRIRKSSSKHLTMENGVVKSHFVEAIAQKKNK